MKLLLIAGTLSVLLIAIVVIIVILMQQQPPVSPMPIAPIAAGNVPTAMPGFAGYAPPAPVAVPTQDIVPTAPPKQPQTRLWNNCIPDWWDTWKDWKRWEADQYCVNDLGAGSKFVAQERADCPVLQSKGRCTVPGT